MAATNEFTNVTSLRPESVGEPGSRTFRIQVDSGSSSAILWLEKEQLLQLALAIQQLIATLPERTAPSGQPPMAPEAPPLTRLEFKVSKLALGHDGTGEFFVVDAHNPEDEETAAVRVWAGKKQAEWFAEEALQVCAAGRPLCPLCGGPIDPAGHHCPRMNGRVWGADL